VKEKSGGGKAKMSKYLHLRAGAALAAWQPAIENGERRNEEAAAISAW